MYHVRTPAVLASSLNGGRLYIFRDCAVSFGAWQMAGTLEQLFRYVKVPAYSRDLGSMYSKWSGSCEGKQNGQ